MVTVVVCLLSQRVSSFLPCATKQVLINTRVIKHLYDRKPAEEFDFVVTHLVELLVEPDLVFTNKDSKRGDYAFVKKIDMDDYFCALEKLKYSLHVVTVFRLRKKNYLKNYKLMWSRRGDTPSS